ncbi:MAG TPA: hypothetical protein VLH35_02260, partial [Candidatus Acidoferrales bacterium]|nr:hypothetical protein [Candidatus Acidoferrales bacterium]
MKQVSQFLASAIIFAMLLSCFFLLETTMGSSPSGTINSDTTWAKVNSPYSLNESVTVENEATLAIEAGVTVELNGYTLQVNG